MNTTDQREVRFREIIEANKDRIYRLCCVYIADPDVRGDVFQEVLIHVWKGLEHFEGRSQISTWVYRIAVNTCLENLRADRRRNRFIDRDVDVESVDRAEESSEAEQDRERSVKRLNTHIEKLSTIDRTLIMLSLEDVSMTEIGEILGISEGNVRVKLHRIRKQLKVWMEGNDHEDR